MSFFRRFNNTQGSSLIEVMVTIVIFLVGIVTIVRLFPGGFTSMRHSESVTLANRLSQAEIERWQGRAGNLPDGIIPWGSGLEIYDTDPTVLTEEIQPGGYYFSGVNRFRRVLGETTRIPMPRLDQAGNLGSIYILAFGPHGPDEILVYGGRMKRLPLPSNPADLDFNSHGEYAIDYKGARLYLLPRQYPREFLISYTYWAADPAMESFRAEKVTVIVPGDADAVNIPAPGGGNLIGVSGFREIQRGADALHRKFEYLGDLTGSSPSWSPNDPYQFGIVTSFNGEAGAGVLSFNPLGYDFVETTARGRQPLTAHIDYTVLDWHIIREERKLPVRMVNPSDFDIRLTLRFIKESGYSMEFDGNTYAGLAPGFDANFDVLVVNMATGMGYYYGSATGSSIIPGTSRPAIAVDYKEGIIRLDPQFHQALLANPDAISPFEGAAVRIYYRAEGDWAVQTFKSYREYFEAFVNPDELYYNEYLKQTGDLYFARCNNGSVIGVDYSFRLADGSMRQVSGDVYHVESDDLGLFRIDLRPDIHKRLLPGETLDGGDYLIINRVYGVSMGARTIWRDFGRVRGQTSWKDVLLQTYLPKLGD